MRPDSDIGTIPAAASGPRPWPPDPTAITPDLIDHYIRRGRRLQAEQLWRAFAALGAALRRRLPIRGGRRRAAPAGDVLAQFAGGLSTPLSAIRSQAELLRDNPDIDPGARSRAVETVLAEEARIEGLVAAMIDVARGARRAPPTELGPVGEQPGLCGC